MIGSLYAHTSKAVVKRLKRHSLEDYVSPLQQETSQSAVPQWRLTRSFCRQQPTSSDPPKRQLKLTLVIAPPYCLNLTRAATVVINTICLPPVCPTDNQWVLSFFSFFFSFSFTLFVCRFPHMKKSCSKQLSTKKAGMHFKKTNPIQKQFHNNTGEQ